MKLLRAACILAFAIGSTACFGLENLLGKSPTSPSDGTTSVRSYLGTWNGPASTSFATTQSCNGLQWKITSQTGNQLSGDFQASCAGGIALAGTVLGTHTETVIPWAATGTATQGDTTCPFTMTGTGTFQGTSNIVVNYAGTTCLGPIGGSDTLKR